MLWAGAPSDDVARSFATSEVWFFSLPISLDPLSHAWHIHIIYIYNFMSFIFLPMMCRK